MKQVKVILGRFQPFTLGHLTIATLSKLNGPDAEQKDKLREQPDLKEIGKQKTIILAVSTPKEKVDARHPFEDDIMKKEFEIIKKNYKEIEDVLYVKSADICAWGEMLKQKGYQASVWITGTDEFQMYKGMSIKVPEYEDHNRDNRDFKDACAKSFYVEEVKRSEGSDNFIETISGTKVREALKNDDKDTFTKMMPNGVDKLYDEFREAVLNAPEPKPKKTKKIKEYTSNNVTPIVEYFSIEKISLISEYLISKTHKKIKYFELENGNKKVQAGYLFKVLFWFEEQIVKAKGIIITSDEIGRFLTSDPLRYSRNNEIRYFDGKQNETIIAKNVTNLTYKDVFIQICDFLNKVCGYHINIEYIK